MAVPVAAADGPVGARPFRGEGERLAIAGPVAAAGAGVEAAVRVLAARVGPGALLRADARGPIVQAGEGAAGAEAVLIAWATRAAAAAAAAAVAARGACASWPAGRVRPAVAGRPVGGRRARDQV